MQRMGAVIGLKPEHKEEYKRLHAAVWPAILDKLTACNIRNYSIFLREPENLLFAYFEYHGEDLAADMASIAADPVMQDWWAVCGPCQKRLPTRKKGEWWAPMESVFFHA